MSAGAEPEDGGQAAELEERPASRTRVEVAANLAGRLWGMLSGYLFIPIYLALLGSEAYGLVTFAVTLQTVLSVASSGWTKVMRREFSSTDPGGYPSAADRHYKLLRSMECFYLAVGLAVFATCWFGSGWLAAHWIRIGALDPGVVITSVRLMGASVALQILWYAYNGCLLGMHKQVRANLMEVSWSIVRNGGAAIVLALVARDLLHYFGWLVALDAIYVLVLRHEVVRQLRLASGAPGRWAPRDFAVLRPLARMAGGLTVVAAAYVFTTQMDRAVVSRFFSLTELGAYNITFAFGQVCVAVSLAFATTALALFTKAYSSGAEGELQKLYRSFSSIVTSVVLCLGAYLAVYSGPMLHLWTGNPQVAAIAEPVAPLVIAGSGMLALQHVPTEFVLARGVSWPNSLMSALQVPYVLAATPFLIHRFGLVGGGVAWCVLQTVSTIVFVAYVDRRYAGRGPVRSLLRGVVLPGTVIAAVALATRWLADQMATSAWVVLGIGILCGALTLGATLLLGGGRDQLLRIVHRFRPPAESRA